MEITIQKHHEKTLEEINAQTHPFEDDLLDRKEIANHLVQIIKNTKSPFVFNINSPYGTGKTFFLTRLKVLLEQEKCTSVLYNSWETDWANDPFVAILEEITEEINCLLQSKDSLITKAATEAWKFVTPAFISLGEEFAKQCIPGVSIIVNATEKALERKNKHNTPAAAATQYQAIKQAKENLRKALVKFTSQLEKPLVIIIDELDRCRPDYAIRTLEAIKHFFNIPNMIFVLAIDREQIESAISVLYGKKIENHSAEYLRKFIDYDFYLPYPNPSNFLNMLLALHVKELIQPFCRQKANWTTPVAMALKQGWQVNALDNQILWHLNFLLKSLARFFNFSLRAQEQIVLKIRMFVSALSVEQDVLLPELLVWNVCLYAFDKELYHRFQREKLVKNILSKKDSSILSAHENINFSSLDELLKPEQDSSIPLSYPLPIWIEALLDPKKKLSSEGRSMPYNPIRTNSVEKYLTLTPLL